MGISKQAVSRLVQELEEMGAVERVPDPTDGRAELVKFVQGSLLDGLRGLMAYEAEFAEDLGEREMQELRTLLKRRLEIVDQ